MTRTLASAPAGARPKRPSGAALAAALLAACSSSTTTPPPPVDNGPGDFNYIPANEGKCDVKANPALAAGAETVLNVLNDYPAERAVGLRLCPKDAALADPCGPCAANPLLDYLNALDAAEMGTDGAPGAVESYFERALSYPLRELLVTSLKGGDGTEATESLVLTQGRTTCRSLAATCDKYTVEPESLEADCSTFTQKDDVATEAEQDGFAVITAKAGTMPFAFYVPLVASLPDPQHVLVASDQEAADGATEPAVAAVDACPAADAVDSEEDFARFLHCQPKWRVEVASPVVVVKRTATDSCLRLTGFVESTKMPESATSVLAPDDYEETDNPGFVKVTLGARLHATAAAAADLDDAIEDN